MIINQRMISINHIQKIKITVIINMIIIKSKVVIKILGMRKEIINIHTIKKIVQNLA